MKKHLLLFILLFTLFLSACSNNTTAPVQPKENENSTVETDKGQINKQTNQVTEEENNQASNQGKGQEVNQQTQTDQNVYVVNPKTFKIQANKPTEQKIVLLTFDDGPVGDNTIEILNVLDKYNAKAIWFINGFNYGYNYQPSPKKAEKFKNNLLEIQKRGHLIGNHTWEHNNLRNLTPEQTRNEIVKLNDLIVSITGEKPQYFRAPFGIYSEETYKVLKEEKMQPMNWSVGSLDWELKNPEDVVKQTVSTIHDGANILMHDKEVTAKALDQILNKLEQENYKFVLPNQVDLNGLE
ncbi:polysaccharide deacetylase family protein [Tepidibacillus sp. HK-1]|uniref:polysaccharide deacetylase family protein n=1 Tax=Tepidibacillus sp. HK-1 TaxID=1883407 RepID=UPI000853093D|nr:polysaccharide deacetylase family protein [Tepidibacillus sp. HK-1]GBF10652.1 peptidoglycan-N-acetylglucosamine deacetylase [Tepidibacillus sp. HK-1]